MLGNLRADLCGIAVDRLTAMSPKGIFDAYREKEVTIWTRPDLDVEDGNIGLKGSPTRVFKSFTKALKGKGTVRSARRKRW